MNHSKEFTKLKESWYRKLAREGFDDLEDRHGNLFQHNIRTIGWQNQDVIRDFYLKLDSFLTNSRLPHQHRQIMELWSSGKTRIAIAKYLGLKVNYVNILIAKYKKIVLESELE